jgi:hypothetical protein
MSCVCILTPVVIAAWPAFSAAIAAAATSLGYTVIDEITRTDRQTEHDAPTRVDLAVPNSEVVTNTLNRDQRMSVARDGITVTFSRDARGKASLCVTGDGYSKSELTAAGEELSQRVVQKYVYQRLMDEMRARQFLVVEEETDTNSAIRLKVRHWENAP